MSSTSSVATNQTNPWTQLLQEMPRYQGNLVKHCKPFYEKVAGILGKEFPQTCKDYKGVHKFSMTYLHPDKIQRYVAPDEVEKFMEAAIDASHILNFCVERRCPRGGDTQNNIEAEQQQSSEEEEDSGAPTATWEERWRKKGPIPTDDPKTFKDKMRMFRRWCLDCSLELPNLVRRGPYDILKDCLKVCDTAYGGSSGFSDMHSSLALEQAIFRGQLEAWRVLLTFPLSQNTIDKMFEHLWWAYLERGDLLKKEQFSEVMQDLIKLSVSPDMLGGFLKDVILKDNNPSTQKVLKDALFKEAHRIPSSLLDFVFQKCSEQDLTAEMARLMETGKISAVQLGRAFRRASARGDSDWMEKLLKTHQIPQEELGSALSRALLNGNESMVKKLLQFPISEKYLVPALSESVIKDVPLVEKLYVASRISLQNIQQAIQHVISESIYGRGVGVSSIEIKAALLKFGLCLPETTVPELLMAALHGERWDVVRVILETYIHRISAKTASEFFGLVVSAQQEQGQTGVEDIMKMLLEAHPLSSEQFLRIMKDTIWRNSPTATRLLLQMKKSDKDIMTPENLKDVFLLAVYRERIEVVMAFQESGQISQEIAKEALSYFTAPLPEDLKKILKEWRVPTDPITASSFEYLEKTLKGRKGPTDPTDWACSMHFCI